MEIVITDDPATRRQLAAWMRARGKERRERAPSQPAYPTPLATAAPETAKPHASRGAVLILSGPGPGLG
jgi:hypothetical protein